MLKKIVVASGKGGTGKTTVAASITAVAVRERKMVVADCDVDAPNLKLILLKNDETKKLRWEEVSSSEKAFIDEGKCVSCGKCVDVCNFGAMEWNEGTKRPDIKHIYCEGCGACSLVCPTGAIEVRAVKNGRIGWGKLGSNLVFVCGELYVGSSASGKIVVDVKKRAMELSREIGADILLVDAPAGLGCPVIASFTFMDHALIVAEPTPTGFEDMKRMLELASHFRTENSIIINKHGLSEKWSRRIEALAREHDADVIARIPHDPRIIEATNRLVPIAHYNPYYRELFEGIISSLF